MIRALGFEGDLRGRLTVMFDFVGFSLPLQDKDPAKSQRVMRAMMQMTKIDIAALERAYRA